MRDWNKIWQHLNRMQQRVMADHITKEEFMSEPEKERIEYYHWLQRQCGQYSCYI